MGFSDSIWPVNRDPGLSFQTQAKVQGQVVASAQAGTTLYFLHLGQTTFGLHYDPRANGILVYSLTTGQADCQPVVFTTFQALVSVKGKTLIPFGNNVNLSSHRCRNQRKLRPKEGRGRSSHVWGVTSWKVLSP